MRKVLVIGIGAGNPDYITVQAINALNTVDVFFVMDKGEEKDDLVRLRKEIASATSRTSPTGSSKPPIRRATARRHLTRRRCGRGTSSARTSTNV